MFSFRILNKFKIQNQQNAAQRKYDPNEDGRDEEFVDSIEFSDKSEINEIKIAVLLGKCEKKTF